MDIKRLRLRRRCGVDPFVSFSSPKLNALGIISGSFGMICLQPLYFLRQKKSLRSGHRLLFALINAYGGGSRRSGSFRGV
jgi:hypothetical protein